jgi:hypothetical protein
MSLIPIRGHAAMVLCLAMYFAPAGAAEAPSTRPALYDDVVRELRVRERKLLNVVVESEAWVEELAPGSNEWKRTPVRYSGKAWYNGLSGSKARIDVHKEVEKWSNGPAPYAEDSYSVGTDGEQAWLAQHSTGPLAKPFPARIAVTSPQIRLKVFNRNRAYRTGAGFSTWLWAFYERKTLCEFLLAAPDAGPLRPDISAQKEEFGGVAAIKVTIGTPKLYEYRFWFDPNREYALLGFYLGNTVKTKTVVVADDRVTKLVEAGPGIWFPAEATHVEDDYETGIRTRLHFRASNLTANDPKFDELVFHPDFPPGYTVNDKYAGQVYQVAPPAEQLEADLNRVVDELSATTRQTTSAPEPADAGTGPVLATSAAPRSSGGNHAPMVVFITVAAAGLAVIGAILYRRRYRPAAVLWIGLCLLAATTCATAAGPERINCAVNTGFIAARFFGRPVTLRQIGSLLQAGVDFRRDCSLLDLKRAMESLGLDVEPLQSSLSGLLNSTSPQRCVILRLKRPEASDRTGHFINVLRTAGGRVVLVDPPGGMRMISFGDAMHDRQLSHFSGEYLVISESSEPKYDEPTIELENPDIELGDIPPTTSRIEGQIKFRNRGRTPLKITDIHTPCACVGETTGDRELPPGERGRLVLVFDKHRLPIGDVTREIGLATNDPKHEIVKVVFRMTVQDAPNATDLQLLPPVLDYGRVQQATIAGRVTTVRIVVPRDRKASPSQVTFQASSRRLDVTPVDQEWIKDADGTEIHVFTYSLSWREPPPDGRFAEEVRFVVEGQAPTKGPMTLQIQGDCLAANGK